MTKAKAVSKSKVDVWQSPQSLAAEAVVALLIAYVIAIRAIDTGSLIEYFATIVLIGFAINRLIKIFHK